MFHARTLLTLIAGKLSQYFWLLNPTMCLKSFKPVLARLNDPERIAGLRWALPQRLFFIEKDERVQQEVAIWNSWLGFELQ